jgi:2'-5' RNA ligase
MPNHVVIARFSSDKIEQLLSLREKLFSNGYAASIPEWPPHITIAAYEDADEVELCKWSDHYAKTHKKFDVYLSSLSVLPPGGEYTETAVICLAPASSKKLIDFYFGFHERLDEFCGKLGFFYSMKFGHPAIHSTIGIFKVKDMQKALEIIFEADVFGKTQITALEVYTYPMKLIKRFELCDDDPVA